MDLEAAIQRHLEWKTKFRAAMHQHQAFDPVIIAKDNYCELGKWLHGKGSAKFGTLRSHADCVSRHAAFHVEAGKVAQTINAKNYADARGMLEDGSAYTTAANDVVASIMKLKEDARL